MSVIETLKSYLAADPTTDIRAALREDHRRISELAKAMADATTAAKRRALYDELKPLLTAHARSEEEIVYRAMIDVRGGESRDLGNEGFVEHSLVDVLLERLSRSELAGSDAWKAHATVLKELLDHHVQEEEGEFFDALGKAFDDRELEAMAADFQRRKAAILGEAATARASRKR
jgi:hemerythrin-like domain-containing protein